VSNHSHKSSLCALGGVGVQKIVRNHLGSIFSLQHLSLIAGFVAAVLRSTGGPVRADDSELLMRLESIIKVIVWIEIACQTISQPQKNLKRKDEPHPGTEGLNGGSLPKMS